MSREIDEADYEDLVMQGCELPESDIEALEAKLLNDPSDIETRFQLLGYYSGKQYQDPVSAKKLASITFWLIDSMPDCGIIQNWGLIDKTDEKSYEEFKRRWLMQVEANKDHAEILACAASSLSLHDEELAENLYRRAIDLAPEEPKYSKKLAHLLQRLGPGRALEALEALNGAMSKETNPQRQYYMLDNLAELLFAVGDLNLASEVAQKCLSMVGTFGNNWNDGNAIHNANDVLGRIALKHGDIESAKKYLQLAGDTPGSPQLDSFGPEMNLAEELFAAGEVGSVVAYLEACRKFWSSECEEGALSRGIEQIHRGETPDFRRQFFNYPSPPDEASGC